MTISATYERRHVCELDGCARHYCQSHRLLWRDCATARRAVDDFHVDGRPHYMYEMGDCPECEADTRRKRYAA